MRPDQVGRRAAVPLRRRSLTTVVFVLLAGITWMHTLGAAPLPQHALSPSAMVAVTSAQPGMATETTAGMIGEVTGLHSCAGTGHGSCPGTDPHSGHASSMCQAPALGGATFTAPQQTPAGAAPVLAVVKLPVTAAVEAADGTGCGPPSLSMLSISRT